MVRAEIVVDLAPGGEQPFLVLARGIEGGPVAGLDGSEPFGGDVGDAGPPAEVEPVAQGYGGRTGRYPESPVLGRVLVPVGAAGVEGFFSCRFASALEWPSLGPKGLGLQAASGAGVRVPGNGTGARCAGWRGIGRRAAPILG